MAKSVFSRIVAALACAVIAAGEICPPPAQFTPFVFGSSPASRAATEGPWVPPKDANYGVWKEPLQRETDNHCSKRGDKNTFQSGVARSAKGPTQSIFKSWAGKGSGYKDMENLLEEESLGPYMGRLAGWIVLLCVGLVISILSCMYSCACKDNVRRWWAEKIFRGRYCHDRARRDPTEWQQGERKVVGLGLLWLIFGCISPIVFGSVMIASQEHFHAGFDVVACDTWLTMYGHFFGTETLTLKPEIVAGWKGAQEQYDKMQELAYYVQPTVDNCIKEQVVDHFEKIKPDLLDAMKDVVTACERERPMMKAFIQQITDQQCAEGTACNALNPYPRPGDIHILLEDTFEAKLLEYIEEIQETTIVGLLLMEENINKYLGPDSVMLHEGFLSASTALTALSDVNYAMAGLVDMADGITNGTLSTLTIVAKALLMLWGVQAILLGIGSAVMYGMYGYRTIHLRDREKVMKLKKHFCMLFNSYAIFGGLSFIFAGICFIIVTVGRDACDLLDHSLLDEGKWELLPEHMWNGNSTDLRTAFDTCIKRDGSGDVAANTGLLNLLHDLEHTLHDVKKELRFLPDELELLYKDYSTDAIQVLLVDAFIYAIPKRKRTHSWREARYTPILRVPDGESPRFVSCFVPAFGREGLAHAKTVQQCGDDIVYPVYDIADLLAKLNAEAGRIVAPVSCAGNVKTEWCLTSLGGCGTGAEEIGPDYDASTGPAADTAACLLTQTSEENIDDRFIHAVEHAAWVQKVAGMTITTNAAQNLTCPASATECTVEEFMNFQKGRMETLGQFLKDNVVETLDIIDHFIENITISTMDELLDLGRNALANFDCQFIGTALEYGTAEGLCSLVFPEPAMTGVSMIMLFFGALIGTMVTWKVWHYLHDVENFPGEHVGAPDKPGLEEDDTANRTASHMEGEPEPSREEDSSY